MKLPVPVLALLRKAGIDRAIGYTLLHQGWLVLLQPVTLWMALEFLSDKERGFYFTFSSILGLQTYFDLGIGVAMQQAVARETGHLNWTAAGTLDGDPTAKSRLASLWRLMLRWYAVMAAIFGIVLMPLGLWLFSRGSDGTVAWAVPWIWIVTVSLLGLITTPALMLIRGTGRVAEVAKFNVAQMVATNLAVWAALAGTFRLYSGPIGNTIGLAALLIWLWVSWRPFLADIHRNPVEGPKVDWWREVWPFQWKIALGWPFGYFVYQMFNPVLFYSRSPEEAGRMGVSLAVATLLTTVSMTWIYTKIPLFTQFIARREWERLDDTFVAAFKRSTALAVGGAVIAAVAFLVLDQFGHAKADRFLSPGLMALLLVNAVVNHVIFAVVSYIRAHGEEPFLASVIIMGTSMGLMTLWVGPRYGATGLTIGYFVLNTIFMIRSIQIYSRCRREWHAPVVS